MPNSGYITLAYVAAWVVLLGYLVRLVRLSRRAGERYAESSERERVS